MEPKSEVAEDSIWFEQCPVCESYNINSAGEDYSCLMCDVVWTTSIKSLKSE